MKEDCLFCKIGKGETNSYTLYEDDIIKVMLDAFPNTVGHTLIIPKQHFLDLTDISLETLTIIMNKAKEVKALLEEKFQPESIILVQNNGEAQKIKHYHLHLIPKHKDELNLSIPEVYDILKNNL